MVEILRQQHIIMPTVDVIERVCSEALTRGTRQVYEALTAQLSAHHRGALDGLLALREGTKSSGLIWLRQSPGPPKPKHVLEALTMKAAPTASELLSAVEVLKGMNERQARKVPDDAPTSFVRKRWGNLVRTPDGLDRRFYELCVLSELKNSVERLAAADELPDASSSGRLKVTPLDNAVPDEAEALMRQVYSLLPHLKITELLLEVDSWTGFTRHFKHLKSGEAAADQHLLLTTILADAIYLGLSKMTESCPGTTYAKLTWLQAWHIRDETYSAGLAELVNAQFRQPFAAYWGDACVRADAPARFPLCAAHPRPGRQAPVHPRRCEAVPHARGPDRWQRQREADSRALG